MARSKGAGTLGELYSNPFAVRPPSTIPNRQKKARGRHTPRWLQLLLGFAILGGAGYGIFYVLHPPVTRSAKSVALDFARQMDTRIMANILKDVEPSQRSTATSDLDNQSTALGYNFPTSDYIQLSSETGHGTTATVTPNLCGSNFSCTNLPTIYCVEIKGSWYVDWDSSLTHWGIRP